MGRRLVQVDAGLELALGTTLLVATGIRWLNGSDFAGPFPTIALVAIGVALLGGGTAVGIISRTRVIREALALLAAGNGPTAVIALVWAASGKPASAPAAALAWSTGLVLAGLTALQFRACVRTPRSRESAVAG
jgi:hypothetical protein